MRKLTPIVLTVFVCGCACRAIAAPPPAKKAPAPRAKVMVPPPPPEIPLMTGRDGMEFSTIGVPLDLMGASDLQRMKTRLEQSQSQLKKKADERNANLTELRARVQQFEQLYTEGVVSKRDLTGARKELTAAEDTDSDVDQRINDVKSDLARIEKRLKALAPKPKKSK